MQYNTIALFHCKGGKYMGGLITFLILTVIYIIKAILSEMDIISDESNQVLNDTINDVASGSYTDFFDD